MSAGGAGRRSRAGARRGDRRSPARTCASSGGWRARTLAMYALDASTALQAFAAAAGVGVRVGPGPARPPLGGAAARAGPARRAASRSMLSAWRGFYRWLGREGVVAGNPVDGVRAPQGGQAAAEGAVRRPRGARCAAHRRRGRHPALAARDRCIVELLYGCGLRVGELVGPRRRRPAARPPAGSTRPTPARTCSARAASGAACRSARRRSRRSRGWLALRARARRRPTSRRSSSAARGTRLTPQARCARACKRRGDRRPACRRTCIRTCCATRSPATCCSRAATCARCRSCWATPTSRRRRSTPSSTSGTCPRCYDAAHPRARRKQRADGRENRPMKTRPPAPRQGALAAAPPPVGVRGQRRRGRRRPRRDGARRVQRRPLPGLGRVQPAVADPRCAPGASTRRSASTPPFFARRIATAVAVPRAARHRQRRRAPGARRVGRAARARRRPLRRHAGRRSSCRPAPSAGKTCIADALLAVDRHAHGCTSAATPAARQREGLAPSTGLAARRGRAPPTAVTIREHGWRLGARRRLRPQDRLLPRPARQPAPVRRAPCATSASPRVLNCYCYTGGFSVAALAGGAAAGAPAIDSSAPALERAGPTSP